MNTVKITTAKINVMLERWERGRDTGPDEFDYMVAAAEAIGLPTPDKDDDWNHAADVLHDLASEGLLGGTHDLAVAAVALAWERRP
jgi:hypothetical protein